MVSHRCSLADCPQPAWRPCAQCGRLYCEQHARWRAHARGSGQLWTEVATVACYTCEPLTASERMLRPHALPPSVVAHETLAHETHMQPAHDEEVSIMDSMGTLGPTPAHPTAHERISDVLVTHASRPHRVMLRLLLADDGYAVIDAPTYMAVLRYLRRATEPAVVVAGNSRADFTAEEEFFGQVMADAAPAGLARRHRFVLLCTVPERLPADLRSTLIRLGVPILHMPSQLPKLVEVVARVASQVPAEGAGESAEGRSAG